MVSTVWNWPVVYGLAGAGLCLERPADAELRIRPSAQVFAQAGQGLRHPFSCGRPPDDLAVERRNPWAPQYPETTLSCLHVILEEEWEHLRYALRDLDSIANSTNDEGAADE